MRKYSSNLAFVDLLFNLLVGFVSLMIIAFLLINPVAKQGLVEPPVVLMVEARWDDESKADVDLWVKSPNSLVGFSNKETGYVSLDRDDLGMDNDKYTVNGQEKVIKRNYEVVNFTALPDGEYIVNVHLFNRKSSAGEKVNIRVTQLGPFNVVYEGYIELQFTKQEKTAISFVVLDGKIVQKDTRIQHKIKTAPVGG